VIARNLTKGEVVETAKNICGCRSLESGWGNVSEKDISLCNAATCIPNPAGRGSWLRIRRSVPGDRLVCQRHLDTATRPMQVRLTLANPAVDSKPEMFTIRVSSEPAPDVLVVRLPFSMIGIAVRVCAEGNRRL
jgi:hypothetical protein